MCFESFNISSQNVQLNHFFPSIILYEVSKPVVLLVDRTGLCVWLWLCVLARGP